MTRSMLLAGAARLGGLSALCGLTLCACSPATPPAAPASTAAAPLAALPLATADAPPLAYAPAAAALPPAPRARVGRLARPADRYALSDRAQAMASAFGDAPPDFTFDYQNGERPWVWRGDDQSTRVAEPLPGGGDRYYYYQPGASAPYFVQDPDYGYGYDNGVLVAVYDRRGRPLPPETLDRQADLAGRYLGRAQAIYQASIRERRLAVARSQWAVRRDAIAADRDRWARSQADDADWRAYHDAHAQEEGGRWDAERRRRDAEAARFAESVNEQPAADRAWQAARQAPAPGPAAPGGPPPRIAGGGPDRFAPGPGPAQPDRPPPPAMEGHRVEPARPGPPAPDLAGARAAQAQKAAADQALAQTRADAARQAQASDARRAQAQAQAAATRQAAVEAERRSQAQGQAEARARAQAQARTQAAAQAEAQSKARAQAQARQAEATAKVNAAHQAAVEALAARQAAIAAEHRRQLKAQADAQAALHGADKPPTAGERRPPDPPAPPH